MKTLLTIILPLVICGCASPSLIQEMKQLGVTDQNTGKIVLTGSEADVGPHIHVEIEEQYLIQEIWDSIYQSRPNDLWYASGYRQADFYIDQDPNPAATLWINESDASHLKGAETRFRCPQLHQIIINLLEEAHQTEKANKAQQAASE